MDVEDIQCLAVHDAVPALEDAVRAKPDTSPINRIPVEILCGIFKHYAHDVIHTSPPISPPLNYRRVRADEDRMPSRQEYAYTWTKVIKVCRRWHDAALSCPGLWSDIAVTHSQWIAKVLARTGQTPLHVLAGLSYNPKGIDALKLVLQEMNRVFSLCISLPPGLVPDLAEHLRNLPPSLLSLELIWGSWYETSNLPLVDVSDIYLHSHSPYLRHISITNVPIMDWTSPILCPTVTTLSWKKPHGLERKVKMSIILAAFKAMSLLENVELENVIPNEIEQDSAPGAHSVELPHLRTLKIHGDYLTPETCTSLLHNLSLPALSFLHLSCLPTETVSFILAPFSPLLQNQARIHALSIRLSGYSLQIHAWTSPGAERYLSDISSASDFFIEDVYGPTGPGNLKPNICLVMDLSDRSHLGTRLLLGFCKNMPLLDVKALRVQMAQVLLYEQWRELFSMMDGVAFLQIQSFQTPALLQALYSPRTLPEKHVVDRLVMSGIHTLQFDDCSLLDVWCQADAMTRLLSILDHRRAGGSQLQRLILKRCFVPNSAQIDAARATIDEVYCTNVQSMRKVQGRVSDDVPDVAVKD